MDYKYINQLLNKYWECNTSVEEENILRTFFSQTNIPQSLIQYKPLFNYAEQSKEQDVLGDAFDAKMLAMVGEDAPIKAKKLTLTRRLVPLFKAAVMVAIILTLGNAMQNSFNPTTEHSKSSNIINNSVRHGSSVAMTDSAVIDTLKQSSLIPTEALSPVE